MILLEKIDKKVLYQIIFNKENCQFRGDTPNSLLLTFGNHLPI